MISKFHITFPTSVSDEYAPYADIIRYVAVSEGRRRLLYAEPENGAHA